MSTLYPSIEAAEVRCAKPEHCKNCRKRHGFFTRSSRPLSLWSNDEREMFWVCDLCGYPNNRVMYTNIHSKHPILTEEQSNWMCDQRWEKDLTLKVIAEKSGISVSRLSDIERRHDAPTPDEWTVIRELLR